MLLLLPLIAFLILLVIFYTTTGRFRPAFVAAAVVWGVILFGITETLSWFDVFARGGIAVAWFTVDLASAAWLWRITERFSEQWRRSIVAQWNNRRGDTRDIPNGLLGGCALLVAGSGLIALMSPPNTVDVLAYHMVRVVNWLDHGNVSYYPAIFLPELFMPPWAEYAMAHLFALASGDRFVNMVQWFSLCGCAIGVSWIAKLLGAHPRGQVLAATVCITIPQGLLQSSGAKNDYVTAFWLVCCICLLLAFKRRPSAGAATLIGLSAALAMLTKGTSYIFLPPMLLVLFLTWNRATKMRFLRLSPLVAAAALLVNAHHYVRNYDLCGTLPSCPTAHDNELIRFSNKHVTVPVIASNAIRNIALHMGTPDDEVNKKLTIWAERSIRAFGIDPNDPGSSWPGAQFKILRPVMHEDLMGNPIHLLLICAAIGILLFYRTSRQIRVLAYGGGLILAFLLFCAALRWQPWHTRLHLPLFVLWSAVVGVVFGRTLKLAYIAAGGTILLMLAMPVLLENRLRPVIDPGNIFESTRDALYNVPPSYRVVADLADRISCKNVGIDAAMGFLQYGLLAHLHAGLGLRNIRPLGITNSSAKYDAHLQPFKPACVICSNCPQDGVKWKTYEAMGMRGLLAQDLSFFYPDNKELITERYRIALRFPAALDAKPLPEPLLSLGKFYQADFFYVRYLGENKVSLGFHHWGAGGPDSAPMTITPDRDYTADILVDSTIDTIEILLNGKSVLKCVSPLFPHQQNEVFIGRNPIGGAAAGPAFSGQATLVPKN